MKKIIVSLLLSLFTFAIASAQSDKKQITISNHPGNVINSNKNYKTADTTTQVKIPSDTSAAIKKNLSVVTRPTQGSLRNQKPLVADSTNMNKQAPANKGNVIPLTDRKNLPVK